MVEEPEASTRDMRDQPIENLSSFLIGVESLVQQDSQTAPALGDAETDVAGDGRATTARVERIAITRVPRQE